MIENFSDKYPKNQFIQLNKNDVDYFASNLYDLIQNAYSNIGGHIEFSSVDSFKNTDLNFWIASDIDDDPNADVVIGGKHTDKGIKITLGGQDGSRLSIATMISKIKDLMKQKGFYTEMDEELARKVKLQPIEDFHVISKVLENKELVNLGNGIYERKIGGKWKRKVLVGIPSISNSDIRFAEGGEVNSNSFMKWFVQWYKPISNKVNIAFSFPNHLQPFKEKNIAILDVFEKTDQKIDAKPYLQEIVQKADEYGVVIYLEPKLRHKHFQDNLEKKEKISKDYLVGYYEKFGFELTPNKLFMKRLPINPDIRFAEGGKIEKLIEQDVVDLEFYDTTPEHAKKYGFDVVNPLYVQITFAKENHRINNIDEHAQNHNHDLIFGTILQKSKEDIVEIKNMLEKNGYSTIVGNNDFYKYVNSNTIAKNKKKEPMEKEFTIMVKKDLPAMYKTGGSIKKGGITYGPSHDDGGIKVLNKATNTMLEVEGGELVLNKKVAALDTKVNLNGKEMTPCEAASELNQMAGNGVAFNCKDVANKQFLEDGGELQKGIEVEKEHMETLDKLYNQDITPSEAIQEVALEHILENPNYYDNLKMMEHENNHKKGCNCCNHSSLEVELKMPRFDNGGTIDFGDVNLPGVQGVDKKKSITDIIEEKEFQENRYTQRQLKNKELYAEAINMLQKLLQVDYKKILLEGDATKYLGRYLDKFKHLNLYKLGWRGTIGVSKEWAGICSVDSAKIESEKAKKTKREISISYNFVVGDDNFGTFMEDTILHEIAHAIVFEVFYLNDFEIPYDQLKFYKPEDVFRFDHPHQMIDPQHFETQGHGVTWANICNTLTGGYICDIFYRMMIKNEQMSNYMYKCINCNHEGFGDNSRFANKCANCGTPVLIQKNK
jgi:predicted SprT family Zn-dependent metalloprotease